MKLAHQFAQKLGQAHSLPTFPSHDDDFRVNNLMMHAQKYEWASEAAEAMEDFDKAKKYKLKAQEYLDKAVALLESTDL